jgi:uncharacterized phage protein (TIGR01671 family)
MIYKFRGKTKSGKWLYGSLMNWKSGPSILTETEPDVVSQEPVLTYTVGQFTGKQDKTGKEVYSGDILWAPGTGINEDSYKVVFIVKFDDSAAFIGEGEFDDIDGYSFKEMEVIGNIHQNPELVPVDT